MSSEPDEGTDAIFETNPYRGPGLSTIDFNASVFAFNNYALITRKLA